MAQQFLDSANVVAVFEKVGGKAVAECVHGNPFNKAGLVGRQLDGSLQTAYALLAPLVRRGGAVFWGRGPRREECQCPFPGHVDKKRRGH
jgi:hypothetical protein